MPEGFIRLEGRGREQFSWKSIRPKHKHRRASNPGLAPAVPLSWLPPLVSLLPPPLAFKFSQRSQPILRFQLRHHLYSMLPFVSSSSHPRISPSPPPPSLLFFLPLVFLSVFSAVFVVAVSVSEAEQSLITGKRTQRRKRDTSGGWWWWWWGGGEGGGSLILLGKHSFSTRSAERRRNWSTGAAAAINTSQMHCNTNQIRSKRLRSVHYLTWRLLFIRLFF